MFLAYHLDRKKLSTSHTLRKNQEKLYSKRPI